MQFELSAETLETIFDCSGVGVIIADAFGKALFCNSLAQNILGLESNPTEIVQNWTSSSEFFVGAEKSSMTEAVPIERVLGGEKVGDVEVFVRNATFPQGLWFMVRGRQVQLSLDGAMGAIITFQDISEKKNFAAEFARSNDDYQQFAYVAAHDLQEPIRTIVGFSELLAKRQETLEEKSADYLTRITNGARRMQKMVAALRSYSRVHTHATTQELCDCNEILTAVLAELKLEITVSQTTVKSDNLPIILADKAQLTLLFKNLLSNAIKFRGAETPAIELKLKSDDRMNVISITDNGIGLEMKFAERIFVIFQRLHSYTEYDGIGAGLAICKRIIERHGGKIWVSSAPGEGSTFSFSLPRVRSEEAVAQ